MEHLVKKLRSLKADLSLVDGKLRITAPEGALDKETLSEVRINKDYLIEYLKNALAKDSYSGIPNTPVKPFYRLSSAQRRLYFLYEFNKSSIAYNMPQMMRLRGQLDKVRLVNTFRRLIERHASFRTCFEIMDREPVQRILRTVDFKIETYAASPDQFSDVINKFIRPFNFEQAPMIRIGLIEFAPDDHLLMIDTHHIITDGTSQYILNREFMALYNDRTLPALNIQYVDYVMWQDQTGSERDKIKLRQFWLEEFSEELNPLQLPQDFERPSIKSDRGDAISFSIGMEETEQLRAIAESEGTTLFMVLLAIYNILLSKLSHQEDVVVGTPIAGRQHADLENIIGLFVNMLPLRNYPKGNMRFTAFLSDLKARTLACFDHQDYQYEALVDELKVQRDTSRNPLFDVMFAYENFQKYQLQIPGLSVQMYKPNHTVAKFDISLTAFEPDPALSFTLEYCKDLFSPETIRRFITYFKKIVSCVTVDKEIRLNAIEIITEEEKALVTNGFNQTEVPFARNKTIDELFKEVVRAKGNAPAIAFENEVLSYNALNKRSNQLARRLLKEGVQREDIVGILLGRSSHIFISIMGVLKAGCAYVPIDPDYPTERVAYIMENSNVAVLLCEPQTRDLLGANNMTAAVIDVTSPALLLEDDEDFEGEHNSSALAYMIYTSGSTGNPKGVMIAHRNVVNMVKGMTERINLDGVHSLLYLSTISFDMSILETFLPLLCGYRIVLANLNQKKDPGALAKLITEQAVNMVQMTPSHLKLLISNQHAGSALEQVKVILYGGEPSSYELIKALRNIYNGRFYNMYGPTETCVWSTGQDMTDKTHISVGTPLANTTIRILDRHYNLQPIGVAGELCIGGDGVARGYWNNEVLTREKFIADPLGEVGVLYRTGDLAKWLPDGNLLFVGRIDNQVKIRGFRIELGEIECCITSYENIEEAAVIVKSDGDSKLLVAYYVSSVPVDSIALKGYLFKKLPEYMVPAFYMQLDKLPLSPNGKLDKRALPQPELETVATHAKPVNQLQRELAEVWAEVLGIPCDNVGINMNFFDLGGDSLKLAMITNKVNQRFKVEIPVATMFKLPMISLLADYLSKTERGIPQPHEPVLAADIEQMNNTMSLLEQLNR